MSDERVGPFSGTTFGSLIALQSFRATVRVVFRFSVYDCVKVFGTGVFSRSLIDCGGVKYQISHKIHTLRITIFHHWFLSLSCLFTFLLLNPSFSPHATTTTTATSARDSRNTRPRWVLSSPMEPHPSVRRQSSFRTQDPRNLHPGLQALAQDSLANPMGRVLVIHSRDAGHTSSNTSPQQSSPQDFVLESIYCRRCRLDANQLHQPS